MVFKSVGLCKINQGYSKYGEEGDPSSEAWHQLRELEAKDELSKQIKQHCQGGWKETGRIQLHRSYRLEGVMVSRIKEGRV